MSSPASTTTSAATDRHWLDRAAALAVRGHGGVSPNPLVGCVIVDQRGDKVGEGHHRRCGGDHAEVRALTQAGSKARGATLYVTLEPCAHVGRTPACVDAITRAGVVRVVFGVRDLHHEASGGADALRAAGIAVTHLPSDAAMDVTAPFLWNLKTGLPWITAKWAKSIDGRIATRTGDSQWFSGVRARALVHRERGRVDAILTGMGTVRSDDPLLTARSVRTKRLAKRVIIAPRGDLPLDSALVRSASETPVIMACLPTVTGDVVEPLEERGVTVHRGVPEGTRLNLRETLRDIGAAHDIRTVLAEAGPGLISSLLDADLVREIAVFVAPLLVGDDQAPPPIRGFAPATVSAATRLTLRGQYRRGDDILVRYGVPVRPNSAG